MNKQMTGIPSGFLRFYEGRVCLPLSFCVQYPAFAESVMRTGTWKMNLNIDCWVMQ